MDEDPTGAETQAHPGHPALDAGMRGATSHSEPGGAAPEEITTDNDVGDRLEGSPPYSGPAGGAVGGTPARGRATERTGRGFRPGGDHRPDTTIGAQP